MGNRKIVTVGGGLVAVAGFAAVATAFVTGNAEGSGVGLMLAGFVALILGVASLFALFATQ